MKKLKATLAFLLCSTLFSYLSAQTLYKSTNAEVSFFSKTPLENIDGKTNTATALIGVEKKEVIFFIKLRILFSKFWKI